MRSSCAIYEHGLGTQYRHVESSNICLTVYKWYVATAHSAFKGGARRFGCALSCGMVAVTELELNDISDCGDN